MDVSFDLCDLFTVLVGRLMTKAADIKSLNS